MGNTSSNRGHATLYALVKNKAWDETGRFLRSATFEQKLSNLKHVRRSTLPDGKEDYTPVLSIAIAKKAPLPILREMILYGGKAVVMMTDCKGNTALHAACQLNPSPVLIHWLIDAGGRDLVVSACGAGCTPLHLICNSGMGIKVRRPNGTLSPVMINGGKSCDGHSLAGIVDRMVDAGGRDLVNARDARNQTALMYACSGPDLPERAIIAMVRAGGKELLLAKNNKGMTALHVSMWKKHPPRTIREEAILEMIDAGGYDLVTSRAELDITPLHVACVNGTASLGVIRRLVDTGGADLVLATTSSGKRGKRVNALRGTIKYNEESKGWCISAMKILVRTGGARLILLEDDDGRTTLDYLKATDTKLTEEQLSIRDEYRRFLEGALRDGASSTEGEIDPAAAYPVLLCRGSATNVENGDELPVAHAVLLGI